MSSNDSLIYNAWLKAEVYARQNDYQGYSKFDALNSPFLEKLGKHSFVIRLLATQAVMRSPWNIRGLLRVTQSRNPKGVANFARAYLFLHETRPNLEYLEIAKSLLDWLLENHSNTDGRYSGICWGYNFPWQSPGFFQERYMPNCCLTAFAVEALLHGYQVTKEDKYLQGARSAGDFLTQDLPVLEETKDTLCLGYVPADVRWKVININALNAAALARIFKYTGDEKLKDVSSRLMQWVIQHRDPGALWPYTSPSSASGIGYDNYHTGGVLDALLDYQQCTGETELSGLYQDVLEQYQEKLFLETGAPKWRDDRARPYDIHGAAQGIISFAKASEALPEKAGMAVKIAEWTIKNMQDSEDGKFIYQIAMFGFRKDFCLMRWCQSWMMMALGRLVWALAQIDGEG